MRSYSLQAIVGLKLLGHIVIHGFMTLTLATFEVGGQQIRNFVHSRLPQGVPQMIHEHLHASPVGDPSATSLRAAPLSSCASLLCSAFPMSALAPIGVRTLHRQRKNWLLRSKSAHLLSSGLLPSTLLLLLQRSRSLFPSCFPTIEAKRKVCPRSVEPYTRQGSATMKAR